MSYLRTLFQSEGVAQLDLMPQYSLAVPQKPRVYY